jgi:outer membrane protein assembly factor BamE
MSPAVPRSLRRLPLAVLLVALVTAPLGGCVYRMNIQQGNFIDETALEQLQVGMTRSQVRFLLGTPMIPDVFDGDRWDYLYYFKEGRLRAPEQRHLVVYFEDDKVARILREGSAVARPRPEPTPEELATARAEG